MTPTTRYANNGEITIAYQTVGNGPLDFLFLPGWISQIEQLWEAPAMRRFLERFATMGRLILFDRRGTGLSTRTHGEHTLEHDVEDALTVLDAAGSERVSIFAYALGGLVAVKLAAEHAERIGTLIMYATPARIAWASDYSFALMPEQLTQCMKGGLERWGESDNLMLAALAPSVADDLAMRAWFARMQRLAASPREARAIFRAARTQDVRSILPEVHVPTLIAHREGDRVWDVRHSRYLASQISDARYVELPGSNSLPFIGDTESLLEEVEEFLTGARRGLGRSRALLTIMFTDIVDATARAQCVGDDRWRDLLAHHYERVRAEILRYGGREVKTVGDGFLAVFDGLPSSALRCAQAVVRSAHELNMEVRVGVHTGEVELMNGDVGGIAVHITSRVCALAGPGEVLVSDTVRGTVVGGSYNFKESGIHKLKGVHGTWPLFTFGPEYPTQE